jgi:hypothetical protein
MNPPAPNHDAIRLQLALITAYLKEFVWKRNPNIPAGGLVSR